VAVFSHHCVLWKEVPEEQRSRSQELYPEWWALGSVETKRRGLAHIGMRLGEESPGAGVAQCSRAEMLAEARSSRAQEGRL
jgi:hypothetical protein